MPFQYGTYGIRPPKPIAAPRPYAQRTLSPSFMPAPFQSPVSPFTSTPKMIPGDPGGPGVGTGQGGGGDQTPQTPQTADTSTPSGGDLMKGGAGGAGAGSLGAWESDPVLKQVQALANQQIQDAQAQALAQQKTMLIQYGDPALVTKILGSGESATASAAGGNPSLDRAGSAAGTSVSKAASTRRPTARTSSTRPRARTSRRCRARISCARERKPRTTCRGC